MTEVQSQAPVIIDNIAQGSSTDKDALLSRLDELLEQYLHTLDEYQNAREQLSKQLSSGYLSLAQANFQNRTTTHYGQASYDERMQTIRTINVTPERPESENLQFCFSISSVHSESGKSKEEQEHRNQTDAAESEHDFPEVPDSEAEPQAPEEKSAKDVPKDSNKVKDPIRWFGILVPPALRSAQQTFISIVEGPIPQLATIARDLRSQEIEIGRVRKQIKKL